MRGPPSPSSILFYNLLPLTFAPHFSSKNALRYSYNSLYACLPDMAWLLNKSRVSNLSAHFSGGTHESVNILNLKFRTSACVNFSSRFAVLA